MRAISTQQRSATRRRNDLSGAARFGGSGLRSLYDAAWVAILSAIEVENDEPFLRNAFSRNVQRYWA